MFFSSNYIFLVLLPTLLLSFLAQQYVRSSFQKWSKLKNTSGMTGVDVARRIMERTNVTGVQLEQSPGGQLSDHYDPRTHTVRMSEEIATIPSVAALAITAHELGHAQQHQEKSPLIAMRNFLLPAVRISPQISYALIFAGFIFNATGLLTLGVIFYGVVVLFMILTLPVEFDASARGMKLLEESGLFVADEERSGARQMLNAAALTYVAAAVTAVLQLLYYLSLISRRR
jgi:hypothetical protein